MSLRSRSEQTPVVSVSDPHAFRPGGGPLSPLAFVWHYIVRGRRLFFPLFALVFLAACCAVGVQYGMKLLVDSMSMPSRSITDVAWPFALFVVLVGIESGFWRTAGWVGAHAIV